MLGLLAPAVLHDAPQRSRPRVWQVRTPALGDLQAREVDVLSCRTAGGRLHPLCTAPCLSVACSQQRRPAARLTACQEEMQRVASQALG